MSGVNATIDLRLNAKLTGAADLGNPTAPVSVDESITITPGTDGLGKADILWADTRALAASTPENLDLAGVIAGLLGGTIAAAEITGIYLKVNTGTVAFFGHASAAFNGPLGGTLPTLSLGAGDWVMLNSRNGWAITATTADLLKADPGGAVANYTIAIIGRTVAA